MSYNSTGLDSVKNRWINDLVETLKFDSLQMQEHFKAMKNIIKMFKRDFISFRNQILDRYSWFFKKMLSSPIKELYFLANMVAKNPISPTCKCSYRACYWFDSQQVIYCNSNANLTMPKIPGKRRSVSPSFKITGEEAGLPTQNGNQPNSSQESWSQVVGRKSMVLTTINQESHVQFNEELPSVVQLKVKQLLLIQQLEIPIQIQLMKLYAVF